jgi:hypothetical protein
MVPAITPLYADRVIGRLRLRAAGDQIRTASTLAARKVVSTDWRLPAGWCTIGCQIFFCTWL